MTSLSLRRLVFFAVLSLCVAAEARPRYSLALFKQVGYWINHNYDCGGACGNHVVYVTVYGADGQPMQGVPIVDADTGAGYGLTDEFGNARVILAQWRAYRLTIVDHGADVEATPSMYYTVPLYAGFYSWQIEWCYQPEPTATFTPLDPAYIYDGVRPNGETHSDVTYGLDEYALPQDAGLWWGQTFVANCNRIVSIRAQTTQGAGTHMSWQAAVYECPLEPASEADIGARVGPIRMSRVIASDEYWTVNVGFGIDEVPVVPGQSYMLKIWNRGREGDERGWLNHWCSTGDYYAPGGAYRKHDVTDVFGPMEGWDLLGHVVGATVAEPVVMTITSLERLPDDWLRVLFAGAPEGASEYGVVSSLFPHGPFDPAAGAIVSDLGGGVIEADVPPGPASAGFLKGSATPE